jgi:hypothetical protein
VSLSFLAARRVANIFGVSGVGWLRNAEVNRHDICSAHVPGVGKPFQGVTEVQHFGN